MKKVIIYNSKTGFTKKYAEWMAEDLKCDIKPYKKDMKSLNEYELVVFGGGIMAGKINGLDQFKANVDLQKQKMFLYATGATSQDLTDVTDQFATNNLNEDEQKKVPFYYFEGGINYDNMSMGSKLLMKMLLKMLNGKKNRTAEEEGMLQALSHSFDHCEKGRITAMMNQIKEWENGYKQKEIFDFIQENLRPELDDNERSLFWGDSGRIVSREHKKNIIKKIMKK